MSKFLDVVGKITIVAAVILGIVYGLKSDPLAEAFGYDDEAFRWTIALTWWVSGAISGAVLIALGTMLNYLEENNAMLRELVRKSEINTSVSYDQYAKDTLNKIKESKVPFSSKLSGYKFKAND
ncbi:hypothetical protein U9M73_13275 [Paenibacillus phoenicis]|uniref:Uncharacterized protein n=1 Tax=Paenibacillus phoenicis TaxID=554117 RepID=A0ABU5PLY8_9BACL|nr:hypothetical protein [Paenibacillus phoenicis]MEA3570956.1 hypothetical protein [Paenibacillus phoenicis]